MADTRPTEKSATVIILYKQYMKKKPLVFKFDELALALLRVEILTSFSIETKLPQNPDKNINSLLISTN